jgi:hypothetical protein
MNDTNEFDVVTGAFSYAGKYVKRRLLDRIPSVGQAYTGPCHAARNAH